MPIITRNGKILITADGKIATSLNCCCDGDPNKPIPPYDPDKVGAGCFACTNTLSPRRLQIVIPPGVVVPFSGPCSPCCENIAGTYITSPNFPGSCFWIGVAGPCIAAFPGLGFQINASITSNAIFNGGPFTNIQVRVTVGFGGSCSSVFHSLGYHIFWIKDIPTTTPINCTTLTGFEVPFFASGANQANDACHATGGDPLLVSAVQ